MSDNTESPPLVLPERESDLIETVEHALEYLKSCGYDRVYDMQGNVNDDPDHRMYQDLRRSVDEAKQLNLQTESSTPKYGIDDGNKFHLDPSGRMVADLEDELRDRIAYKTKAIERIAELETQVQKYREALEDIASEYSPYGHHEIAKDALK